MSEKIAVPQETAAWEPRIVAFFCNWCTYLAADLAGTSRMKYASNARVIRVMCSGRIDPQFVMEAFVNGADGVLIGGCHFGDCHYQSGNHKAARRFRLVVDNMLLCQHQNVSPLFCHSLRRYLRHGRCGRSFFGRENKTAHVIKACLPYVVEQLGKIFVSLSGVTDQARRAQGGVGQRVAHAGGQRPDRVNGVAAAHA